MLATLLIELALHERGHQVHDGHAAALHLQTARGFETEQSSANHHGFGLGPRSPHQLARIVERAEREDAVLVEAFDRRQPRRAAGGDQQRVVRRHAAIVAGDGLGARIDVDDANADAEIDLVPAIPLLGVNDDLVGGLLAGEDRRQHHAVVVDVRLVAEDGDAELRLVLEDLLDARHARHSVADHDEALHRTLLAGSGSGSGSSSLLPLLRDPLALIPGPDP